MRRDDVIEMAALKLCKERKEDPDGKVTVQRWRGQSVVTTTTTYLEIAKADVQTVLDFAVPGFLDGAVEVLPVVEQEYR